MICHRQGIKVWVATPRALDAPPLHKELLGWRVIWRGHVDGNTMIWVVSVIIVNGGPLMSLEHTIGLLGKRAAMGGCSLRRLLRKILCEELVQLIVRVRAQVDRRVLRFSEQDEVGVVMTDPMNRDALVQVDATRFPEEALDLRELVESSRRTADDLSRHGAAAERRGEERAGDETHHRGRRALKV